MRLFAQKQGNGAGRKPFISVIIPAHNEEQFLPPTLEALQRQNYPHYEVIVVANGCRDRTTEAARAFGAKVVELKQRGLGPARNTGAREARGDLLVFLDADTLLDPGALAVIAREFGARHAMGTVKGIPDSKRASYKLFYFWKNFLHKSHAHHGSSGVIICWKDQFEAAGGFDNELYLRENSDLMKKLRRFGGYKYVAGAAAVTSMRRYEKAGLREMFWLWLRVWYLSNFSDIRNQTYEQMIECAAGPGGSRIHLWILKKLEKKQKEFRPGGAHAG